MNITIKKTDAELKNDVLSELKYEPSVKVTDIGVLAKDGTVTLNGYANSYGIKWEAVSAVKRVSGVKAVADDIEVKLPDSPHRTDADIASAAVSQIDWSTTIPLGTVIVTVRDGWLTLEGEVEWRYQKDSAMKVVRHLAGVKGVANLILIKPKLTVKEIETDIKSAFERNAVLEANKIKVETSGNKVTLRGIVRNYAELEEAERVAWAAPGVFSVENQIGVEFFGFSE
jgi:osmotically-inducible protein OsmY